MSDLVEGRNAVVEALRAGVGFERVLIARGVERAKTLDEITRLAQAADVPVEHVARTALDELCRGAAHQGVVGIVPPYRYTPLAHILSATRDADRALVVVLDHLTDPHNLGAVARSAEVAGAAGLVIPSRRSVSVGPSAMKASAGALAHIPVAQETNVVRAIDSCKEEGFWVVGASEQAEQVLWDAPLEGRLVLVMGAEDTGLARLTREHCDFLVSIPVAGKIGSLNVAQAATVLMFEWVRRNHTGT